MSLLKTPPKALDERTNAIASLRSPSMRTNNDREGELKSNHRSQSASSGLSEARSPKKRDSKFSVCTGGSVRSHQEYLDTLEVPTSEMVERITEIQERKEAEIRKKRVPNEGGEVGETDRAERERAANLIQRSYRGHRERRIMAGLSLDPTTRWLEAVKEAQYRNLTTPRAKREVQETTGEGVQARSVPSGATINYARQNWKKIGLITRRAGGDEESDSEGSGDDANTPEHEREERRKREMEAKLKRRQAAKIMDLQYFLEMVDVKHRYGSNLRIYHEEWKRADTKENFFYWLDYGEGRFINCQGCPRERLDREQVRYLSKEERLDYLVKIDKEGRLCWAKNGARIDTTEEYKDSMNGIVPATENAPVFRPADAFNSFQDHPSVSSSTESEEEIDKRADRYATPVVDKAKGVKKVSRISAATIVDKLLRGSVKNNTWIFVADTSFRLYVGIKQSGAFQHSSFLHGSRISAAGSITIKNGRLSKLSPLSGHYRPPVSNFKAFTHSLKEAGVDMSHVSISRSYAVLVGLEAYVKTRRRGKSLMQKLMQGKDKILSREDLAEREEAQRHKRESAAKEQRLPEHKRETDKDNQNARLLEKMHLTHTQVPDPGMRDVRANGVKDSDIQVARTGPENAIASEGRRDA